MGAVFPKDLFKIIKRSQHRPLCRAVALKRFPVRPYSVVIFIFWSFGTVWFDVCIWEQLLAHPGAVSHLHISHEQTQSNVVCCFQTFDAVYPKDHFSNYVKITSAIVVPCSSPIKTRMHANYVKFLIARPVGLRGSTLLSGNDYNIFCASAIDVRLRRRF